MTRYFCTYFDSGYLSRGLALYHSLVRHCCDFKLWILCMDDDCYDRLKQRDFPEVNLIKLSELEKADPELANVKESRTRIEYYFTCSPAFPYFILTHHREVDLITYLDADLFFFSSPEPLFEEIGEGSVAIIQHRLSPSLAETLNGCGEYNVGWVSFRRDIDGLKCLRWWHERCIEWCYDRVEDGKFADQKYLEQFSDISYRVVDIQHKGANLAPWNVGNYFIQRMNNQVMVNREPLIFYHFHGFKQVSNWLYRPNLYSPEWELTKAVRKGIYEPYIKQLSLELRGAFLSPGNRYSALNEPQQILLSRLLRKYRELKLHLLAPFLGEYIVRIGGRVW